MAKNKFLSLLPDIVVTGVDTVSSTEDAVVTGVGIVATVPDDEVVF